MAFLDQKEITHFLAQELFYQQYINLEGLNSGVPTRTTPTLTPTTLRNIEQTFIELQSKPEPHENEAGFVPPLVHSIGYNQYISASEAASDTIPNLWHSSVSQSSSDCDTRSTPPLSLLSQKSGSSGGQTRRNMGGRKPNKDLDCSPEEEERRRIRRERNKAAAARCRKRRVDHTNSLIMETEDLERKKCSLQDEICELRNLKDQLEQLLNVHKNSPHCRLNLDTSSPVEIKPFNNNLFVDPDINRVKTEYIDQQNNVFHLPSSARKMMPGATVSLRKPNRPNSLNVGTPKNTAEVLGAPLSTPSTGMTFNFDSLMGGGTGLTPIAGPMVPSCSIQQRNMHIPVSMADMASPDACGPPKLVSL